MAKSYSSELRGLRPLLRQISGLYHLYAHNIPARVQVSIADAHRVEQRVQESVGVELRGLKVLEIGPGQFLSQSIFLASSNQVICIDRDLIVKGLNPLAYLRMFRTNGALRAAKTVVRKLMGVDRKYASSLRSQLQLKRLPEVVVKQMDVTEMTFAASTFDFVYSRSVLHSLPDAGLAAEEIARVLKPGGVAYISVHPYTSETGSLDPRIYTSRRHEVMGWPHLRPRLQDTLFPPNVYLNKFRLADWENLLEASMPGCHYIVTPNDDAGVEGAARKLQAEGELLDYSIEELVAGELVAIWRKPQRGTVNESQRADSVPAAYAARD